MKPWKWYFIPTNQEKWTSVGNFGYSVLKCREARLTQLRTDTLTQVKYKLNGIVNKGMKKVKGKLVPNLRFFS